MFVQKVSKLNLMDVATAFLNREIEYGVYMKQPKGIEIKGKVHGLQIGIMLELDIR